MLLLLILFSLLLLLSVLSLKCNNHVKRNLRKQIPAHIKARNTPSDTSLRFNTNTDGNTNVKIDNKNDIKIKPPPINDTIIKQSTTLSLSLSQIKPFLDIATPFFQNDKIARDSLAGVVALTLINSGISVGFSYVSRDFYNALNERNEALFYEKIGLFFGFLCIAVPVNVAYRFYREKLSLYWREALTKNVLDKYYANRTFYVLETLKNVDNPDQRVAEDIKSFTKASLDFFITLFTSVIDLISFSAILYSIYPLLFVAIIIYAGIGSIVTTNLGQSLVGLNYDRLNKEANFRFSLIRTRENAESIALYDATAGGEKDGLWDKFKEILVTQLGIITAQRNLEYFTTSYRYLVQILPSLIVAPLYFAHKVELGTINQSYSAFNHILGDFSIIINQFEALSAFSASIYRLTDFFGSLDNKSSSVWDIDSNRNSNSDDIITKPNTDLIINQNSNDPLLSINNLSMLTPDGHRLLIGGIGTENTIYNPSNSDVSNNLKEFWAGIETGINVEIHDSDKILIVGPSGAGKSSFVRAIAGLWRVGKGQITWNIKRNDEKYDIDNMTNNNTITELPRNIFILPQKPYMTLGNLKEQIMYPLHDMSNDKNDELDQKLLTILDNVKLEKLAIRMGEGDSIKGLYAAQDWSKVLSLGEQQRLSFARIIFNKPDVIVLDEATSALDLALEEAMYENLINLGATYISVGHRPSLIKYHNKKLILRGPGYTSIIKEIKDDTNLLME